MVKAEDFDENGGGGALRDGGQPQPAPVQASLKVEHEDGQPSSSSSYLRSRFIGMGFSPMLVDKVLQRHGDSDSETIVASLLAHPETAVQKSGSESSSSLGSLFDSDTEENTSPFESSKDANHDVKPEPDTFSVRSYLLCTMNFSQQEVDLAFNNLGEEAPLDQLVDFIVTAQVAGFAGGNQNRDATNEVDDESLYGLVEKTLHLLQMGFTEEEVSSAIESFGQEAKVQELADSILNKRISSTMEQKEVKIESDFAGDVETECSTYHNQRLNYYDDDENNTRVKRRKHIFTNDGEASSSRTASQPCLTPWLNGCAIPISNESMKEEVGKMISGSRANIHGDLAKPPYFIYGNVVEVSNNTWRQLSNFLFNIEPEIINSQFFSAVMRKEGYIHNLPTEKRSIVVPKSPMVIEDALPFTKQWWPSWDTRKHMSSLNIEVAEVEQICENLGKMIRESRGILSEEKRMHIVHQCKMTNLIWVGRDRLSPLEPHQMERILGYPHNHTNLFGLKPLDRIAAMKYGFQTDTIAYLLSALKDMYPDGMRVLSIYSGIGGAEVTLHRLGIPLKCVVSVEESDVNRKILQRWWGKTEQIGELRQFAGIWKLNIDVLRELIQKFGGFDLVIGGNYSSCRGGSTVSTKMGMNLNHFHEYVRVVQLVRNMHLK